MHDEARILARLTELGEDVPLRVTERTGSTNDDARAAAQHGAEHGACFVTSAQTSGRGRGQNRWHSPPGENVYLSVLLRPQVGSAGMAALTLAVGVAVAALVDAFLIEPRAQIKWPNDVYVDGRKLAGVLVEATLQGDRPPVIVVGIGLNVLTEVFPAELASTATSLAIAGAERLDPDLVAAELIVATRRATRRFFDGGLAGFIDELRRRDFLVGKEVAVDDVHGMAGGIDGAGRLLVGDRAVSSGAVRIRA